MEKERKLINPRPIVVFDREVTADDLKMFSKNFIDATIVVNGNVLIEGKIEHLLGDLYVSGNLFLDAPVLYFGNLYVTGDISAGRDDYSLCAVKVYCYGDIIFVGNIFAEEIYSEAEIDSYDIYSESLYCAKEITSKNIEVNGDLYCKDNICTYNYEIAVAGDFTCEKNVITKALNVYGEQKVYGTIEEYKGD